LASTTRVRLDLDAERLWRDGEAVHLRPKSWDVLRLLVEQSGRLVTKRQLIDAVWPGIAVTEGTLNKSIGELRLALADDTRSPRFIETVARRGFRWIGGDLVTLSSPAPIATSSPSVRPPSWPRIIAREHELEVLDTCMQRMLAGERQVLFIVGEAGGGKTTLVDAFMARHHEAGASPEIAFGQGQCVEAFGQHEPYLPLLESLEQLAREDPSDLVRSTLGQLAPSWLAMLPALGPPQAESPNRPASPLSLLRELVAALEEIATSRPLVLIVEDAHVSDVATVDLCHLLARRRGHARIFLIVTLRPADAVVRNHPIVEVKAELVAKQLAKTIALQPFSATAVRDYLNDRLAQSVTSDSFVQWIHYQTGGNPLFVRAVTDELSAQRGGLDTTLQDGSSPSGMLRDLIPDNLRELLERRLTRLPSAQLDLLEAASVLMTGNLETEAIAAAAAVEAELAEEQCLDLTRHRELLTRVDETSDPPQPSPSKFRFLHGLVQAVVYDRVPQRRRSQMHLRVAEWLERNAADGMATLAPQLAFHFEMGDSVQRAIPYLQLAAESALQHGAARDAVAIRQRVLELWERQGIEADDRGNAMMLLAQARQVAFGFGDREVEVLFREVLRGAEERQAPVQQFTALVGLHTCLNVTARYPEAESMSQKLLAMAALSGFPPLQQLASFLAGSTFYRLGRFREAHSQLHASLALDGMPLASSAFDVKATATVLAAVVSAHLGQATEARALARAAVDLAVSAGPYNECVVSALAAGTHILMGDDAAVDALSDRALGLATQHGFDGWVYATQFVRGRALCRLGRVDEGLPVMREAHEAGRTSVLQIDRSLLCANFADELLDHDPDATAALVDEGLDFVERTGESHWEPELYRLRAILRCRTHGDFRSGEADLRRAIELARAREAHWCKLRAATAFAQLASRKSRKEAYATLDSALRDFENDETVPVVAEARVALAKLT